MRNSWFWGSGGSLFDPWGGHMVPNRLPESIKNATQKQPRKKNIKGRPRGAFWSILPKSSWSPCPFETRKQGVSEMDPFLHLFCYLFFVKMSVETASVAMSNLNENRRARIKVFICHFLCFCIFLETHVFHDVDFEWESLIEDQNFTFFSWSMFFSSFFACSLWYILGHQTQNNEKKRGEKGATKTSKNYHNHPWLFKCLAPGSSGGGGGGLKKNNQNRNEAGDLTRHGP